MTLDENLTNDFMIEYGKALEETGQAAEAAKIYFTLFQSLTIKEPSEAYIFLQKAQALSTGSDWQINHEMAKFQWKVAGMKQDALVQM